MVPQDQHPGYQADVDHPSSKAEPSLVEPDTSAAPPPLPPLTGFPIMPPNKLPWQQRDLSGNSGLLPPSEDCISQYQPSQFSRLHQNIPYDQAMTQQNVATAPPTNQDTRNYPGSLPHPPVIRQQPRPRQDFNSHLHPCNPISEQAISSEQPQIPRWPVPPPSASTSPPILGSNSVVGGSLAFQQNPSTPPPDQFSVHDLKEAQQSPVPQPSGAQARPRKSEGPPSPPPNRSPIYANNSSYVPPALSPPPMYLPTRGSKKRGVANTAGNLSNILPTGTVLVFQALTPSLSRGGKCQIFDKFLFGFVIAFCAASCFLSSFTDSFEFEGHAYYGFATCNGLYVFNYKDRADEEQKVKQKLKNYKLEFIDFVHAIGSLFVFLVFAFSNGDVLDCFFPKVGVRYEYSMVIYLPLVAGALSSFLFSIFPTKRRGIGVADCSHRS